MPDMFPFLLPGLLALNTTCGGGPMVALDYGVFQGASAGNLSVFLGVPYSQPVTRFALPKPPVALPGVQDATDVGAACPQQEQSIKMPVKHPAVISENCLTLNIIKPTTADAESKLPVFFYLHSGGFEIGNNEEGSARAKPLLDRALATNQPFIFVAPNYRISAYGFLAGKEAVEKGISNLGLRDQIFALEWVQKHIVAFGGDPKQVVIGGVSAGAMSVALLSLENKIFDQTTLFRGAFMLSGSAVTTSSVADGQADYDLLVAENNCTSASDTLECLKQVPFEDFKRTVDLTPNVFSYSSLQTTWRPRVDGEVIVHNPLVSVARGLRAKIPFMVGTCDDEGTLFTLPLTNITTNEHFEEYIHKNYLPNATPEQIAKISALYPDDPTQGSPFDTGEANIITPQFKRLAAFQGDYTFIGPRRFFLQAGAASETETRRMWSWVNKRGKARPMIGAGHASDFPIFLPTDEEAEKVRETFAADALINFINTLDPNRSMAAKKEREATDASDLEIPWPTWDTPHPSVRSSSSVMILSGDEEKSLYVGADDFRAEAIAYLFELLLEDGQTSQTAEAVDEIVV